MAAKIDYLPLDLDMMLDEKVYAFMRSSGDRAAAMADYGRLVLLLQEVYRGGFYMAVTPLKRSMLAEMMGLDEDGFDAFVRRCVACGLFDRGVLERTGALTSLGIQRRYFAAKRSSASKVSAKDRPYVVDENGPDPAAPASDPAALDAPAAPAAPDPEPPRLSQISPSPRTSREVDQGFAESAHVSPKEKRRELKRTEVKRRERSEEKGSSPSGSGASPLGCLSQSSSDGGMYSDGHGGWHGTMLEALSAHFARAAPGRDFGRFAGEVAGLCPPGCSCSLAEAERCFELVSQALARYDPSRAGSPFPLAKRILADERGGSL